MAEGRQGGVDLVLLAAAVLAPGCGRAAPHATALRAARAARARRGGAAAVRPRLRLPALPPRGRPGDGRAGSGGGGVGLGAAPPVAAAAGPGGRGPSGLGAAAAAVESSESAVQRGGAAPLMIAATRPRGPTDADAAGKGPNGVNRKRRRVLHCWGS